jgi:hypothetical protein
MANGCTILKIAAIAVLLAAFAGCATYRTTLTNAQGQTVTCEASGKSGVVTGYYLRKGFEDCIDRAHAAGYNETPPPAPAAH